MRTSVNPKKCILRYARHGEGESVVIWEFFAADVEGIEGVGAVGAVFEQVFFGLGELFAGLILAVIGLPLRLRRTRCDRWRHRLTEWQGLGLRCSSG